MKFRILKLEPGNIFRVQKKHLFWWSTLTEEEGRFAGTAKDFDSNEAAVHYIRGYVEKRRRSKWIIWTKNVEL